MPPILRQRLRGIDVSFPVPTSEPMLIVVLILNLLIASCCWFTVWRLWQLRQTLSRVTKALTNAEQHSHTILQAAPVTILHNQSEVAQLRQQYQQALFWVQQVKQIMALWGLGQRIWQQTMGQPRDCKKPGKPFGRQRILV
jgi:hypothetical protein